MSVVFLVLAAIAVLAAIVVGVIAVRRSTLAERRTLSWLLALVGAALLFAPAGVAFGVFGGDLDSPAHLIDVGALSTMIGWSLVLPVILPALGILLLVNARRTPRPSRRSKVVGWMVVGIGAACVAVVLYAATHLGNHLCC